MGEKECFFGHNMARGSGGTTGWTQSRTKKLSLGAGFYVTIAWKGFFTQSQVLLSSIVVYHIGEKDSNASKEPASNYRNKWTGCKYAFGFIMVPGCSLEKSVRRWERVAFPVSWIRAKNSEVAGNRHRGLTGLGFIINHSTIPSLSNSLVWLRALSILPVWKERKVKLFDIWCIFS